MIDTHRIQVDLKNLPDGVEPKLRKLAFEMGFRRFSDYWRTVVLELAEYEATGRE